MFSEIVALALAVSLFIYGAAGIAENRGHALVAGRLYVAGIIWTLIALALITLA